MGLSQSLQGFVNKEINDIAQDARMEAAQTLMGLAQQEEQVAANIFSPPSGPRSSSSSPSGSYVSNSTASLNSRRTPARTPVFAPSPRSTPSNVPVGPSSIYIPETPLNNEYNQRNYQFRQPGFGGVEQDDIMRNQRGF